MTDLEITKRCAEAMGFSVVWTDKFGGGWLKNGVSLYAPLFDDIESMRLIETLRLYISPFDGKKIKWVVAKGKGRWRKHVSINADLNRAICECVANMAGE